MAVEGKISAHTAKITEFEDLADKSDDDHTAIDHLLTLTTQLNDVLSGLLSARNRRSKRSVEGKKNIFWVYDIL